MKENKTIDEFIVTPVKLRTESDECVCCEGRHIYCHSSEPNLPDWINSLLYKLEEGKKYKITVTEE
jgi:hypothetical protein